MACLAWSSWVLILLEVFAPRLGLTNDHYNDDYNDDIFLPNGKPRQAEVLDDLPLQDARILRDTEDGVANMTTPSPFQIAPADAGTDESGAGGGGPEWIVEAIKDVAYYLRAHKFNEYDRRYEANGTLAPHTYHYEHPRPPLRSLHWEVHKFCDESFLECIAYLWKRTQGADLRRVDDTAVVIQEQRWRMDVDRARIDMVDAECQRLRRRDGVLADPFQGPLERYQWRSTAAYFMCWYTMHEVEQLRHLQEACDNFANCLEPELGPQHRDPRANDEEPFECAMYSFCPDPCCRARHIRNLSACWEAEKSNPCYSAAPPDRRECWLDRSRNLHFTSAILNHWNVTCACPLPGYVWDSRYGICVDVDECQRGDHKCDLHRGDACLNTVGGYKCVCKWGHAWSNAEQKCLKSEAIGQIKLAALKMMATLAQQEERENMHKSYLRRAFKYFQTLMFPSKTTSANHSMNAASFSTKVDAEVKLCLVLVTLLKLHLFLLKLHLKFI